MCIFSSLNKAPFYVASSSASTLTPSFTRQIALPSLHIFRGNISHWTWTHSHITEAVDFHCQTHYKREKKRWLTPPPVVIRINLESPRLMKCDDLSLEWLINVSADTSNIQIFRARDRRRLSVHCMPSPLHLQMMTNVWTWSKRQSEESAIKMAVNSKPQRTFWMVYWSEWWAMNQIKTNHDQVPAMKVCELSSSDMWIITILSRNHKLDE